MLKFKVKNTIKKVQKMLTELTMKTLSSDINESVLVSLLLTLKKDHTFPKCFYFYFEQVNL